MWFIYLFPLLLDSESPTVIIDGYTVDAVKLSRVFLPLDTTIILVCRVSGIPHGILINYHWTCPNGPCQQTGYAGRQISNNILAINITSTRDGGTYTCKVTAEGREASQQFLFSVSGQFAKAHTTIISTLHVSNILMLIPFLFPFPPLEGHVVHSYGRLIPDERVITVEQELQPPDDAGGDGRIECLSTELPKFDYHGYVVGFDTSQDVYKIERAGSNATTIIRYKSFEKFQNIQASCDSIKLHLSLSNGENNNNNIH